MVEMASGGNSLLAVTCAVLGVSYLRVMHEGRWPLAKLTNVMARKLSGTASHFVKLDVDGLLAPDAFLQLRNVLMPRPSAIVSIRPRRLPEGQYSALRWEQLVSMSEDCGDYATWGMCMAHSFTAFEKLRGHDESFDSWGYEDNNYVHRVQEAGFSSALLDTSPPLLLHQWHPPTADHGNKDKEREQNSNGETWGEMVVLEDRPIGGNQFVRAAW